jgi:hypothetical protein
VRRRSDTWIRGAEHGHRLFFAVFVVIAVVGVVVVAGCGTTAETPKRELGLPYKVMLVGDGVMTDSDPGIRAAVESMGPPEINDQAYWGFALSKPNWYDWRSKWSQLIATYDPDAVVALFGIHDAYAHSGVGGPPDPGGSEWQSWYRLQVTDAMQIFTSRLANVYWMGMMPVGDPVISEQIRANNLIVRDVVQSYPTGRYLEPDPVFVADGGTAQLFDPVSGLPLRKFDGVHVCAAGAEILGLSLATAIASDLGTGVGNSFLTGQWRSTESFLSDAPMNCAISAP